MPQIPENEFIIGSRPSKLAQAQAGIVIEGLKKANPGLNIGLKLVKTTGDNFVRRFTKEIEDALLGGKIDAAVHSAKDLATELPEGLKIAAILKREDPRDCLISRENFTLKTLPLNSRIGTSSLRRRAQALNIRPDLKVLNLAGNVDTRIRKLNEGLFDAIVVAYAGIKRLGPKLNASVISIDELLPQAGQGALAVQIRKDDLKAQALLEKIDDPDSHIAVTAERQVLSGLAGGCQVPIGVYAAIQKDNIEIRAAVFSLDGKTAVREKISGKKQDANELARQLADSISDRRRPWKA